MSILIKIFAISFVYICLSITLKNHRQEFVFLMRMCAIILILAIVLESFSKLIYNTFSIFEVFKINSEHISLILKVTGIAIITDFLCDTLIDSGEKSIANVVSLSSKILIIYLSLPILNGLIIFCLKFVE